MDNKQSIKIEIRQLQQVINKLLEENKGIVNNDRILEISKELDDEIIKWYRPN